MLLQVLVATLSWTNPAWLPDSLCRNTPAACHLTGVNIYRMVGSNQPVLIRGHSYVTAPASDTIQVPDTQVATWFVYPVNAAGESTCPTRGFTVGVPTTGVAPEVAPKVELYDVAGRKVAGPLKSGVYFQRVTSGGKIVERIVVMK